MILVDPHLVEQWMSRVCMESCIQRLVQGLYVVSTGAPKVCEILVLWAALREFGSPLDILLGSRHILESLGHPWMYCWGPGIS